MKKRRIWLIFAGVILFLLVFLFIPRGGWIASRLNMLNMGLDTRDRQHFEPIVIAIANKDHATLFNMFSSNVQETSPALDDDIHALFGFISGDIVDWDVTSLLTSEDNHHGKKQVQYQYPLHVSTDTHAYIIRVTEQARDDYDRSTVGLVSLEAYDKEDPDVIVRAPGASPRPTKGYNAVPYRRGGSCPARQLRIRVFGASRMPRPTKVNGPVRTPAPTKGRGRGGSRRPAPQGAE